MEFHGKYSIKFHGTPWNSMEVFYTGGGRVGIVDSVYSYSDITLNGKMDINSERGRNARSMKEFKRTAYWFQ